MADDDHGVALLEARNVSKAFGGVTVLADVSFDVAAGDFVVLRGVNGSGKTTLLNIMSGLLRPDRGTITLRRDGRPSAGFAFVSPRRRDGHFSLTAMARNGVLRSWQDVRLFPSLSLIDNLNVAAHDQLGERPAAALFRRRTVRKGEDEVRQASFKLLESFGIAHLAGGNGAQGSVPDAQVELASRAATGATVSLGQAKRAAIARACRGDAALLLLDEPLSGLDEPGIRSVTDLLRELNGERGIAMLVVEHESNVEHVAGLATSIWTLENGGLAVSRLWTQERDASPFINRWKQDIARDDESTHTFALPAGAWLTVIAPRHGDGGSRPPALSVRDLRILRAGRPVLPPLSLSLPRGSIGILEAPNGWGKTSLAEALTGFLPVEAGEVALDGRIFTTEPPWTRRRFGLSMLQSRSNSFPKLKVSEALRVSRVQDPPAAVAGLLSRTVSSLSGGERQRLLFACAQAGSRPRLCLWDEPFIGLDEAGLGILTDAVRRRAPDQTFLILLPSTARQSQGG